MSNNDTEIKNTNGMNGLIKSYGLKFNKYQLSHRRLGFIVAIIKKYSQDQVGNQTALVTYYGFLALFPLLVAALSITEISILRNANLKITIIKSLNIYFPLVGHWLQSHIHAEKKAGATLAISLLLIVYGARGVASALQQAMNHIWQVPKSERPSGLKSIIRSFEIIILGGLGFIATGFMSAYVTGSAKNIFIKIITTIVSLMITFIFLLLLYKLSLSKIIAYKELIIGSIMATIGLQIIQFAGGFLITHELKHFSSLYGSLALVLVVLFWIYLQVRILLYATEVDSVISLKLWPRSLVNDSLTNADRRALTMYIEREAYIKPPAEEVDVTFKSKD